MDDITRYHSPIGPLTIRSGSSLIGFPGGPDMKCQLLNHEKGCDAL